MKRRFLSIITALALCLSLLPVNVLAAEDCDHLDENNDHCCDECGDPVSECADAEHDHYCDTCGAVCWVDENADGLCDGDSYAAVLTHVQADYTAVVYRADSDGNTVADVTLLVDVLVNGSLGTPSGTVTVVWSDGTTNYSAQAELTNGQAEVTYTGLPLDALEGANLT